MSDPTPPPVAGPTAERRPSVLTDEAIDAVLAEFRSWLENLARQPESVATGEEPTPAVDLHTLVGSFTALRHEVNLQTKAVRAQQEQNGETLKYLSETLAALERPADEPEEADEATADETLRPLLKTLVEVYDALALAERESRRVQDAVLPALEKASRPEPAGARHDAPAQKVAEAALPGWARWLGLDNKVRAALEVHQTGLAAGLAEAQRLESERRRGDAETAAGQVRDLVSSLLTGYAMGLQRLDRALRQHGLEPMACVGQPFDPERMEVVEAVAGNGRAPGEVVAEVRRGYLWNGRIFRFAQVSVAKS
jgi:molecular chaperone GrpE